VSGRGTLAAVIVIAATVIVAAGLSIVLGGGGISSVGPSTTPTAAPTAAPSAFAAAPPSPTDFPAVATPAATGGAGPSAGPGTSAAPSPPVVGIVARRIQIPRLGIDLKIIEGDGIDAPIGKAAHFPGTAWPDGGSNIYIYGHAREGMFLPLWDAKLGDKVVLTLADGTERTYVVDKVLPKVPYDAVQYLQPTPTEQLTLQTSTSYYETAPRFVVIAHPGS
jgi:LPXTG-site transpeptidase (sortase) family protein